MPEKKKNAAGSLRGDQKMFSSNKKFFF